MNNPGRLQRLHWALVVITALALLVWRFRMATLTQAEWVQWNLAYGAMGLSLAAWFYATATVLRESLPTLEKLKFELMLVFIWGAALLFFWSRHEPIMFKINFDEPQHAAVALSMHLDGRFALPSTTEGWDEHMHILKYTSSYRGGFYSYLVSLFHDFTGYTVTNAYRVNGISFIVFLLTIYLVAKKVSDSGKIAFTTVILASSVPLLAQTTLSAGYDITNLTFLALYGLALLLYAEKASRERLMFAATSAVLLALIRSESLIYIGILGTLVTIHARKTKILTDPGYALLLAPGLLCALAVQVILVANPENISQHDERAVTGIFSFTHLLRHGKAALEYFFTPNTDGTGCAWVAWLGIGSALLVIAGGLTRRIRWGRSESLWMAITIISGCFYAATLCSFWGGPDVAVMTRFTLPLWFVLILAPALLLKHIPVSARTSAALPWVAFALFCGWTVPAVVHAQSTRAMNKSRLLDAAIASCRARNDGRTTFITESHLPFQAHRIPAYSFNYFCNNASRFETAHRLGLHGRFVLLIPHHRNGVGENLGLGRDLKMQRANSTSVRPTSPTPASSVTPQDSVVGKSGNKDAEGGMRLVFEYPVPGYPAESIRGYEIISIALESGIYRFDNTAGITPPQFATRQEYEAFVRQVSP